MSFTFTSQHVVDYHQLGFVIFRDLIPAALINDLRRETDKGRDIARKRSGENAQRLQPIVNFPEIDMKPFDDYHSLPALRSGLTALFEEGFGAAPDPHATRQVFGVLYEPAAGPWCTHWHRDWRDNIKGLQVAEWEKVMLDIRLFNQINCAIFDDSCTWVVPGSHLRRDTPAEAARFPDRPIAGPKTEGLSPVQIEIACREYCESLPGAMQVHLNTGDYLLYRNSLWHIGNYVPYRKRATIHDGIFTPQFKAFFENPPYKPKGPNGEPPEWDNPNVDRAVVTVVV